MEELEHLVATYGGLVVEKKIQKKEMPDFRTYVGKGKLEEICESMIEHQIPLLIVGNILKAKQMYEISERLSKFKINGQTPTCRDRVDLILKIFERHAKSTEARFQIELAAIKHMGPRIFGMGMELSRQGGSAGKTSGIGETNTEIMRRHLKTHQLKIRKKIQEFAETRALHRQARLRKNLLTVGIVGYTNAGKSSLMRLLTHKEVLVENKLFATLGTSVGNMIIANDHGKPHQILISDTIGFIRDLPPDLIDAFRSTLEDSIQSQLLIHLIDASDPHATEKIGVVDDILHKIGADQEKLYVFNKIDLISASELETLQKKYADLKPIRVSTHSKQGVEELRAEIVHSLGIY
jgi:GTP-binding protein HflX